MRIISFWCELESFEQLVKFTFERSAKLYKIFLRTTHFRCGLQSSEQLHKSASKKENKMNRMLFRIIPFLSDFQSYGHLYRFTRVRGERLNEVFVEIFHFWCHFICVSIYTCFVRHNENIWIKFSFELFTSNGIFAHIINIRCLVLQEDNG